MSNSPREKIMDETWNKYAKLYNLIAVCMESNHEDAKQLQLLIELAIRLEMLSSNGAAGKI